MIRRMLVAILFTSLGLAFTAGQGSTSAPETVWKFEAGG